MEKYYRLSTAQDVIEVLKFSINNKKGKKPTVADVVKDKFMISDDNITGDLAWDIGRIISATLTRPDRDESVRLIDEIVALIKEDDEKEKKHTIEKAYKDTCLYWFCRWKRHLEEEIKKEKDPELREEAPMKQNIQQNKEDNENYENREDKALITPKDIYKNLWNCRDFELKHFWQRSVFLATFLLACYPGYGILLFKILETNGNKTFGILNVVALTVALLGVALSVLYIMMAKGSKYWYECYEKALYWIERDPKYCDWKVAVDMDNSMYLHGSVPSPERLSPYLMSLKAWRYSPSKINIAIGQISMLLWIIVYAAHVIYFSVSVRLSDLFFADSRIHGGIVFFSLVFWVLLMFVVMCPMSGLDSSTQEEREQAKREEMEENNSLRDK